MPDPDPQPMPQPLSPNPASIPTEVDSGELHSLPEVDYGNEPSTPLESPPENPPVTIPERELPYEPETEPGKE